MIGLVSFLHQGNYVACLIAMLQLMDEKHYQKYVQHFPSDQDLLVSLDPVRPKIELVILLTDCQTFSSLLALRIWSQSYSR